jgi:hydroxymethylglutaryl-CoA reductase
MPFNLVTGADMDKSSELSGFHRLTPKERLDRIRELSGLDDNDVKTLTQTGRLGLDKAGMMIENVIGTMELPFGIATNFMINGKEYLVPMVLEEPSVVAAASNAAKLARPGGGFSAEADDPVMIGQIQLVKVPDRGSAREAILGKKDEIISLCNRQDSTLVKFGGGAVDVQVKNINSDLGDMMVVHILVDVRDAMGANAVNTMSERVTPLLEEASGGKTWLERMR